MGRLLIVLKYYMYTCISVRATEIEKCMYFQVRQYQSHYENTLGPKIAIFIGSNF